MLWPCSAFQGEIIHAAGKLALARAGGTGNQGMQARGRIQHGGLGLLDERRKAVPRPDEHIECRRYAQAETRCRAPHVRQRRPCRRMIPGRVRSLRPGEGTLPESIRAEKEQKVTQGETCGRNRPAQQGFQMGKGKIMGRTAADPDHHARPMQQVQFGTCIVGRHGSAFCQLPQGKMSQPLLSSLRGKGKRRLRNGFQDSCRAPAFFHGSSFQEYSCFYRI